MTELKLLLVEDEKSAVEACRASVDRYMHEKERSIVLCVYEDVHKAKEGVDDSFDGAIIDLKLSDEEDGGIQVLQEIEESLLRLPVFILTGYPNNLDEDFRQKNTNIIKVFIKGEPDAEYDQIIDRLWSIYDTGITRIMGGRGTIEVTLSKVFLRSLLPTIETWEIYGKQDSDRTEKALLRHTLNHLTQLLEEGEEQFFPEELYLIPPLSEKFTTGSMVRMNDQWLVVLSPACDLVPRSDGKFKTDRILLVETEEENMVLRKALDGITRRKSKKRKLKEVFKNNYTDYYHWLPKTDSFDGRFLNFRRLKNMDQEKFQENFCRPEIQVSPSFVKDIVARFSTFYARQGQPDIEFKDVIERYLTESSRIQ